MKKYLAGITSAIAAQGWAEEKNGFTILFEETT